MTSVQDIQEMCLQGGDLGGLGLWGKVMERKAGREEETGVNGKGGENESAAVTETSSQVTGGSRPAQHK